MSHWFQGHLTGHYVGTPSSRSDLGPYASADRYKMRIYQAVIRDIETLDAEESKPSVTVDDGAFVQSKVENTRLYGVRPRQCFEGTVYDVAVQNLCVTHSTKKGNKTYGRIEGDVVGRYVLPPEAKEEAAESPMDELAAVEEPVATDSRDPLAQVEEGEPLHGPDDMDEDGPQEPAKLPIPLLVILTATILALGAGMKASLLWVAILLPALIVRFVLSGMFKVTNGQRVFGAVLILVQFACLVTMLFEWWMTGCRAINVWAFSGIGATALIASVLPSPVPVVVTGGSLALVFFLWHADIGTVCSSPETQSPTIEEQPAQRPSVQKPGTPRTNPDGTWPRRKTPMP